MESQLYSIEQVSEKLGTTIKAVRRLVASGAISSVRRGGVLKVSATDFYDFEKNRKGGEECKIDKLKVKRDVNWVEIADDWQSPKTSNETFVDLFCGAGGLSKGLEMAGLEGICGLDWFVTKLGKRTVGTFRIHLLMATSGYRKRRMNFMRLCPHALRGVNLR